MSLKSFTVINYTSRCVNHLAAELAQLGYLKTYVRPYANQGRGWERWLEGLPGIGEHYAKTLGRRKMPCGLARGQIAETAQASDFLSAALHKLPVGISNGFSEYLGWAIQRRIARAGGHYASGAETVVATCVVAEPAFEKTDGRRILNYPIANYNFSKRLLAEEAQLEPAFASTLSNWQRVPNSIERQLEAECRLADAILVGSTFVRDTFLAEGMVPEKLVVIPYGADVTQFHPLDDSQLAERFEHSERGLNVLFVGQLSQRKGISYLLRAFEAFRGPNTQLTLVGNYSGDPGGIASYRNIFRHIPHVPQAILADLYRAADVFVFPTLIEGLPLVLLEAMASGLPVIATPNGPADLVRDGVDGFIVPIRDTEAITEKLEYFRTHPDERCTMGSNARARALEFTWSAYRENAARFLLE